MPSKGATVKLGAVPAATLILLPILAARFAAAKPLHDAVRDGDLGEVQRLIAEGADVNERERRLALRREPVAKGEPT